MQLYKLHIFDIIAIKFYYANTRIFDIKRDTWSSAMTVGEVNFNGRRIRIKE